MTEAEIILVKKTWKFFRSIDPAIVGDTFYSKLFADNPRLRAMFPENMHAQYQKLMSMLNVIVIGLDNPSKLSEELAAMAHRHTTYGVRPAHYKLVGNALLWTLQKGLGNDWNEEVKVAWTKCYSMVAEMMMRVDGEW